VAIIYLICWNDLLKQANLKLLNGAVLCRDAVRGLALFYRCVDSIGLPLEVIFVLVSVGHYDILFSVKPLEL
jgi:hypothetical protein